jgi:hypothetical protein
VAAASSSSQISAISSQESVKPLDANKKGEDPYPESSPAVDGKA